MNSVAINGAAGRVAVHQQQVDVRVRLDHVAFHEDDCFGAAHPHGVQRDDAVGSQPFRLSGAVRRRLKEAVAAVPRGREADAPAVRRPEGTHVPPAERQPGRHIAGEVVEEYVGVVVRPGNRQRDPVALGCDARRAVRARGRRDRLLAAVAVSPHQRPPGFRSAPPALRLVDERAVGGPGARAGVRNDRDRCTGQLEAVGVERRRHQVLGSEPGTPRRRPGRLLEQKVARRREGRSHREGRQDPLLRGRQRNRLQALPVGGQLREQQRAGRPEVRAGARRWPRPQPRRPAAPPRACRRRRGRAAGRPRRRSRSGRRRPSSRPGPGPPR